MEEKGVCVEFSFRGKKYLCSLELAMDIVGGKWKPIMIYHLRKGLLRSSDLMRRLHGISNKMFTQTARELEAMGIVERKVFPVVPQKVEYSLTELGKTTLPFILDMAKWGKRISDMNL